MALKQLSAGDRLYWELNDLRKKIDLILQEYAAADAAEEEKPPGEPYRFIDPRTGKPFMTQTEKNLEKIKRKKKRQSRKKNQSKPKSTKG